MKKIIATLMALVMLSPLGVSQYRGQSTRITPPQPNYEIYGSYSRQLRVYEATQRRLDALDRQRYRRFREEVRRNMPRQETRIIVRRQQYTYGDALASWRRRRTLTEGRR